MRNVLRLGELTVLLSLRAALAVAAWGVCAARLRAAGK
jgi:hypothetical protein